MLIFAITMGVAMADNLETATFAGGCFWCMEPPFEKIDGVASVISGYTGGDEADPSYFQVASGRTHHAEAVEIKYDPSKVSYEKLLDVFWRNIDPTQKDGQFADKGPQYRSAIFTHNDDQMKMAEASKAALTAAGKFEKPIVTEITAAGTFYKAEQHHQHYYKKNSIHYKSYQFLSGRGPYLKKPWGP